MPNHDLPEETWIEKRKWEYYSILIDTLLSNKIDKIENQELVNIYDEYQISNKEVPIQLQEYINSMMLDKNIQKIEGLPNEPYKDYKRVLLVTSVIRRQALGVSKVNAIDAAAKYFKIPPKVFFDIYPVYLERAEEFIKVEPDLRGLDKLLGL
ncbi:MAG: hypothetical protein VX890_04785 [Pseudomonadota bacterium]|nr:hypothetical protein [Pseudomonadota bacterium]|tara:strand:+ start:362 stop:820 length:459 start_codon:yes stop_codon:yes gene_type:complete